MAVYELLESNHPSLSVPVTEVTDSQEGREQIQQDLVDTMRAKSGIGLSANQIGIGARVFTMYADVKKKDIIVCFNPKIITLSEETVLMDEGCLSYPGLWLKVRRAEGIEVTYENVKGDKSTAVDYFRENILNEELYNSFKKTDYPETIFTSAGIEEEFYNILDWVKYCFAKKNLSKWRDSTSISYWIIEEINKVCDEIQDKTSQFGDTSSMDGVEYEQYCKNILKEGK